MKYRFPFLLLLCTFLCGFVQAAQRRNQAYENYIKKYHVIAVEEMKKYKIPASITLAQGLLESGAGNSSLAKKSNNHFGIKCGSGWRGRTVRHSDNRWRECFRAYDHPRDSYEDHSKFLVSGSRYASLFRLKITDYKGWAKGLKKAGYATDPRYASRLIDIIELYDLDKYDRGGSTSRWVTKTVENPHPTYISNDLLYIVARAGDSFKSLSKEFHISSRMLRSYNELPRNYKFTGGEIIYLQRKHKKAGKEYQAYVVRPGDSIYSIAQKFGVQMKYIYKMNKLNEHSSINVGDVLRLN